MSVGEFIFSRVTIVLSIIMILSIPALCTWPLFHVNAGKVSSIEKDTIFERDGKKFHEVLFRYNGHLQSEKYNISSKREMLLYDKLCNGVYMKRCLWPELIYIILWCFTISSAFVCWIQDFFTDDLLYFEKEKLAKIYIKIIKSILKFLGYDPEKVENLKLTIRYNEKLSFIGCFTQLAHSLQE